MRLVIGLPVYNGENYLAEAIESILGQTFTDFSLLISDNASTDATEEICRRYAAQDSRIEYLRQPKNIGAGPNFNAAFRPGSAPYFKWAAHDDVLMPEYLAKCIELLDRDPSLSIAHSPAADIDAEGKQVGTYDYEMRLDGDTPSERFWKLLWTGYFTEVFGVFRSDCVARSPLMGSYVGGDRNFMADMLFQGNVGYVEEYLFLRRKHPDAYCNKLDDDTDRQTWFDTAKSVPGMLAGPVKLKEYVASLMRHTMPPRETATCMWMILEWAGRRAYEQRTGDGDRYRARLRERYAEQRARVQAQ